MRRLVVIVCSFVMAPLLVFACGGSSAGKTPTAPPCDQTCTDQISVVGTREVLKVVYNLTLQGQPVGAQDASTRCPIDGSAQVYGTATSNAVQGSTMVDLTYVLDGCVSTNVDPSTPTQNYGLVVSGTFTEQGTLAVQPSSTTAIGISGTGVSVTGLVDDPSVPVDDENCALELLQNGNGVSGTFCGREVGASL